MLAALGEVMVETFKDDKSSDDPHFAGDTFNTAVAMAQLGGKVCYVTAIGIDILSDQLLANCKYWDINTDYIQRDSEHTLGSYCIHTDDEGERSFSYDRNNSAAKHFFANSSKLLECLGGLKDISTLYLSGITVALCSEESFWELLGWLKQFRKNEGKVIFDSNYRPALWSSVEKAKKIYRETLTVCDIYLPSLVDEKHLWGETKQQVIASLKNSAVNEVIIKNGYLPTIVIDKGEVSEVKGSAAVTPLDTTGAGDAFSGAYLHRRLKGCGIVESIEFASAISADVVKERGALLPKKYWQQYQ